MRIVRHPAEMSTITICSEVHKAIRNSREELKVTAEHYRANSREWNEELQYTFLGLLVIEVYDRGITKEYFVDIIEKIKIFTQDYQR